MTLTSCHDCATISAPTTRVYTMEISIQELQNLIRNLTNENKTLPYTEEISKEDEEFIVNAAKFTPIQSVGVDSITSGLIGEYVICRSINEGVNAGFLIKADKTGVLLKHAIRLWRHTPKDKSMVWYEGVALSGLSEDSKTSPPVPLKAIIEDYSLTVCSDIAMKSIREHKSHAQS